MITQATLFALALNLAFSTLTNAHAQTEKPKIHMIYMGGNDCPPCVAWRAFDLPKLQATAAFKSIQFSYVAKVIRSPVPALFWLPEEVKPHKEKLDIAGNKITGSAQTAILVNGEVYDYYTGTRSAEEIEKMIIAIQNKTAYPFSPCAKVSTWRGCSKISPSTESL